MMAMGSADKFAVRRETMASCTACCGYSSRLSLEEDKMAVHFGGSVASSPFREETMASHIDYQDYPWQTRYGKGGSNETWLCNSCS